MQVNTSIGQHSSSSLISIFNISSSRQQAAGPQGHPAATSRYAQAAASIIGPKANLAKLCNPSCGPCVNSCYLASPDKAANISLQHLFPQHQASCPASHLHRTCTSFPTPSPPPHPPPHTQLPSAQPPPAGPSPRQPPAAPTAQAGCGALAPAAAAAAAPAPSRTAQATHCSTQAMSQAAGCTRPPAACRPSQITLWQTQS
jgi:hypothetical protein